jgi:hypothetical protein
MIFGISHVSDKTVLDALADQRLPSDRLAFVGEGNKFGTGDAAG